MGPTKRREQNGRKTRKNEFLPFLKIIYQRGGGTTVWTPQGTYSVTSIVGQGPNPQNNCTTEYGVGVDGQGLATSLIRPQSFDIDSAGNILILETSENRLRLLTPSGKLTTLVRGGGYNDGLFSTEGVSPVLTSSTAQIYGGATALAINRSNDVFYSMDMGYHYMRAAIANSGLTFSGKSAPGFSAGLSTPLKSNPGNERTDGDSTHVNFKHPNVMTVDPRGTRIYVGESENYIRMIDVISPSNYYTSSLYSANDSILGLAVDYTGTLFFTFRNSHCIWKIVPPAAGVRPTGNMVPTIFAGKTDSPDYNDATGVNARFSNPHGLTVDSKNNLYVADRGNNLIRVITPTAIVYTFAGLSGKGTNLGSYTGYGDGPNTFSMFSNPIRVAAGIGLGPNNSDLIYVLDGGDGWNIDAKCRPYARIRKLELIPPPSIPESFAVVGIDPISVTFSWAAGTGITGKEPNYAASFYFLIEAGGEESRVDLPANSSNILPNTPLISNKIDTNAQQGFYIQNTISLPLTPGTTYRSIKLVAYNNSGSNTSAAIRNLITPSAAANYTSIIAGTVGESGHNDGPAVSTKFNSLRGCVSDLSGNIYVVDAGNHCIRFINRIGATSTFFGTPPMADSSLQTLNTPTDLTFAYSGTFPLYVTDTYNNRILSIDSTGAATLLATTGATIRTPAGITVDPNGNLYVTSSSQHCVYKITPAAVASVFAGKIDSRGSTDGDGVVAMFSAPIGITYDSTRNCLYVADTENHLIRLIGFDPANTVYTLAGSQGQGSYVNGLGSVARFNNPRDVSTDISGNVYVSDSSNHCIRKITPAGLATTYSGVGQSSGSSDGRSTPTGFNANTSTVKYNSPYGICRGIAGNFIITDSQNFSVRILSPVAPPTPPTSLALTAITTTTATISWSGDTGGTSYVYTITPSGGAALPTETASPATFTNLIDSTAYTLSLFVVSNSGVAFPPPVKCITPIDPNNFVVDIPLVNCTSLAVSPHSVADIHMNWTGVGAATTMTYTISPGHMTGATTGTLPPNPKPRYNVKLLTGNTDYTITLTANIANVPGLNGGPATTYSVTAPPVTFRTPAPRPVTINTLAGVRGSNLFTNAPSTPSNEALLTTTLNMARDIVMDKNGALFVACQSCIIKIDPPALRMYTLDNEENPYLVWPTPHSTNGSQISLYAGTLNNGSQPGNNGGGNIRFYNTTGLGYDPIQDVLYISDSQFHVVIKLYKDSVGTPYTEIFAGGIGDKRDIDEHISSARFDTPQGVAVGPDSSVYVTTYGNSTVRKISGQRMWTISSPGLNNPRGITVLKDGTIFVCSTGNNSIYKLVPNDSSGITYTQTLYAGNSQPGYWDGPLLDARFSGPMGMYCDTDDNVYVYDAVNARIRLLAGTNVLTVVGTGSRGNTNGDITEASIAGFSTLAEITGSQVVYIGMTGDVNGNIYIVDGSPGSGFTVRGIIPRPPPMVDQIYVDTFVARRLSASSARQQVASSAKQQVASSALQQDASSALQQKDSSARRQRDSSALQQRDSSALQQQDSSARQQRESSALQQEDSAARPLRESSARAWAPFLSAMAQKEAIQAQLFAAEARMRSLKSSIHSRGGPTDANTATMKALIQEIVVLNGLLKDAGAAVAAIDPVYTDPKLERPIVNLLLAKAGIRMVRNLLKGTVMYYDSNNRPITDPAVIATALSPLLSGGGANSKTRKIMRH